MEDVYIMKEKHLFLKTTEAKIKFFPPVVFGQLRTQLSE